MVVSSGLLKNIDHLKERMDEIRRKYKQAFRVCFWIPLAVFVLEVVYYGCLVFTMGIARVQELKGYIEIADGKLDFSPDMIIFLMPLVYIVFSFVCFKSRNKAAKYFLMIFDALFAACCIYVIISGYHEWYLYAAALLYSVAVFIVCAECINADKDEEILSKIEGYPHFNPILIHEDVPIHSEIKFPDKKSYDQLYDERMAEYAEEFPDTEAARLYKEEQEYRREKEIDGWLDGMFTKNEKSDEKH